MATHSAPNTPYIFISYANADRERVLPVVDLLTRAGIGVWIDREGIHGGANYGREIAEAIKGSAALLLMASSLSLASRNVKQEIAVAWDFERPYVPLLLEPVTIPTDVRYWLTAAQWIEVLDKPDGEWLPAVLTALVPLGIVPQTAEHEEIKLAGRERELTLLREKLNAAKEGKGGLALIGGEAGIGKTTLAEALLHDARSQDFAVLEGHCFDLAETPPYGPWIDLFAHYVATPSSPPLPDAFVVRGTVGAVASQIALFVAMEDFLRAATAQRPALILLDDLHWADPASLDLLRFLARSVAGLPLLILVTYRSDELTRKHPLSPLLPQLAREAGAVRLDLGRLDDGAVRSLIVERYGVSDGDAERLAAYLQARAEGNALFVGELLRSLEEAGTLHREGDGWLLGDLAQTAVPALLRQVIDGRLGRLDAESQRLLAVAAVVGHEMPLDLWAEAAESDEDELLSVVEECLAARLLVDVPGSERVRFAHALIREALYEGIPGIRRRRLHRRIGEALTADETPDPDVVAYHFRQAGDDRATEWLVVAGKRAAVACAFTTAIVHFEEVLLRTEDRAIRAEVLIRLARILALADTKRSIGYADEALRIAREIGDSLFEALALHRRGAIKGHVYAGPYRGGLADLEAASALYDALPEEARARIAQLGMTYFNADELRDSRANTLQTMGRYEEALRVLGRASDQGDLSPLTTTGIVAFSVIAMAMGQPDDARAASAQARDAMRAHRDYVNVTYGTEFELSEIVLPYQSDDLEARACLAQEAEAAYRQTGDLTTGFSLRTARVGLLVIEGEWTEARDLLVAGYRAGGHPGWRLAELRLLGQLARAQGDPEQSWSLIRETLPDGSATEPGETYFVNACAFLRLASALALDTGDLSTAREWLEAHDRWLAWNGAMLGRSEGQASWAQYYRQMGDTEQAYEHAERAFAHATEPRQPLALLAAYRLMGELDTDADQFDAARSHLDASLALADACAAPYERALTLLAMAELHAATGKTTAARTLLDEVHAICTSLGAQPTLDRVATLAARLTP